MKMLIATLLKKVPTPHSRQRASVCKRCGVRIYSLDYLRVHLESHKRK